ncbi:MAG: TetR/AcrR family transcriptional regulator [Nonlabens sp.]
MPRELKFDQQKVLKSAMELFWLKGYNATSMQDLVDATGLNRSSLYNTFGDKMQLYAAALQHYMKQTAVQFEEVLKNKVSAYETIENIFKSFLPEIARDSRGCMSMNCKAEMNADSAIKKWLETKQEQSLAMFQQLIEQGQQDGSINTNKSSRTYAWHVFNAFQGYRMTGILEKDPHTLKGIINTSLEILR